MSAQDRSLADLVGDLGNQASTLFRTEARLLKTELSEKLKAVGTSAMEVAAGGLCIAAALIILLQALVIALAEAGLGMGWASLLVGVVVAGVGIALVRNGSAGLKAEEVVPERTQAQLESDAKVLKEQIK